MKNRKYRISVLLLTLLSGTLPATSACFAATSAPGHNPSEKPASVKTGYEVDGRTSASVLAAKRAHSVDRQDEIGLAVYSGVFVIGLIVFFTQLGRRK
ncbi:MULTISPECIES: hypothetical protein [Methylomonas]|nr:MULTISPECIES: hypothetical protein [Methylomonas]